MLNENGVRELAYIVCIDEIRPIEGYDRIEHARLCGWWVVVRKGQFKVDDLAVYIEIDSKVPKRECFEFLEKRDYRVKTQRFCKGKAISQGLLMSAEDFGWTYNRDSQTISADNELLTIGSFVTEKLGIIYYEPEDNTRKADSVDKYKKMTQRRSKLFKKPWARWMMRREWGRKVMFFFFGKKKDKKGGWPSWVVKTDEERCQNMPYLFPGNPEEKWIVTEKIDGTSTTFTMKGFGKKRKFYVCSRNVVFDKPDKKCFYDFNIYTEMAEKYHMEETLAKMMEFHKDERPLEFITVQGESYGEGVQRRIYGLTGHDFRVFNIIFGYQDGEVVRLNPIEMVGECALWGLNHVPVLDTEYILPETCDELLEYAASAPSKLDGEMREGVVFRSYDGKRSFKAVSNAFLEKYHN
jgi:hypothetical protein